jgi:glycine/D-amino acid oxidase-like deaminating enzyme
MNVYRSGASTRRRSTLPRTADVVIVGGGCVGVAVAIRLVSLGRTCVVLDARQPWRSRAGWGTGGLVPGTVEPYPALLARWGRRRASRLWDLGERGGRDLAAWLAARTPEGGWRPEGAVAVATDAGGVAPLTDAVVDLTGDGFDVLWFDPGTLASLAGFPLRPALRGGMFLPGGGVFDPHALGSVLNDQALGAGVRFVGDAVATGLDVSPSTVTVRTATSPIVARGAVVASDGALGALLPDVASHAPVRHRVTVMTTPLRAGTFRGAWSFDEGRAMFVQRRDGRVVLTGPVPTADPTPGGHPAPAGPLPPGADGDPGPDRLDMAARADDARLRLVRRFEHLFPALTPLAIETCTTRGCARPRDRLPIVGRWGGCDHVWVAAGLEEHASFLTIAAEVIARGLAGRLPPGGADALSPARFGSGATL